MTGPAFDTPVPPAAADALVASGIEVAFGGIKALAGVGATVVPGRIVGLIGRNGSGKSTLFNCMTGFVRPGAGRVTLGGADITGLPAERVVRAGIARTFQTPRIAEGADVRTAVLCGFFNSAKTSFMGSVAGFGAARREERRLREEADAVLEGLGLADLRHTEVRRLSMGLVRMVDVARCIASGARFILLDEPAAGLTQAEQETLSRQIRDVAARGVGILLVEHNFALVRSLCETVVVLETGRVLCEGAPETVARDPRVLRSYLGAVGESDEQGEAAA
ncbi:ABC transporter ATP-binding protein [Chelatococcus reniformis]|uniref:ABC transporter ATP-binding protein n=1 Tax=Chelatococcus reniformis TaxID=1494448 RepID=A0A916XDP9_9HYPH|nr:ATP-binding cassette domain-containing protein [Chelatococcus reniformis]GGC66380.1 ABC transporter ATP-binding protein [Chelatococcus reniformis]